MRRATEEPDFENRLRLLAQDTMVLTGAQAAAFELAEGNVRSISVGVPGASHQTADFPLRSSCGAVHGSLRLHSPCPPPPGAAIAAEAIALWVGAMVGEANAVRRLNDLQAEITRQDSLLREANHRITNNIASVAALLQLQARSQDIPDAQTVLLEAVGRVQTFGRIHEALYRSGTMETIAVADHFDALLGDVAATAWTADGRQPEVRVLCPRDARLPTAVATPLSLIAVELVMNAVKHAARPDRGLAIDVTFDASHPLTLTVADNGPGFNRNTGKARGSFGLTLVEALTSQLGGSLAFGRGRDGAGAAITVSFPTPSVE